MLLDLAESTQHNSALVGGPPLGEIHAMQGETEELWRKYCERAIVEQDPERLLELVAEINRLLEEKEERLKEQRRRNQ